MRADMAAAYLDERNDRAFHNGVRRGIYPPPIDPNQRPQKWRRTDLEKVAARNPDNQNSQINLDDELS